MNYWSFWKTFLVFLLIGLIGIGFLVPSIIPVLKEQLQTIPNVPDLPFEVLVIISLINPVILLIVSIIVGQVTAPKLKLHSYLYDQIQGNKNTWVKFKANIPLAIILGMIVSVVFFSFELIFQPHLPDALKMNVESWNLLHTLSGIFYGGIVEEILMRWGLMSFIVWVGWKVFQRSKAEPTPLIFWISIVISSIIFALGHLGATILAAPLTPLIFIRMLLLNGIGGIVFGWLYWKKGLEVTMIAHATVHISTAIIINISI